MLANTHGSLLSPKEVKGLLGEMYFLKFFLCARYGAKEAVLSWTGPKHLPQDYIIDDTWYEVKTVSSSRTEVTISSIEQLDCVKPGELIIIRADKTSVTNTDAVNLNTLYKDLLAMLSDDDTREQLSTMLCVMDTIPDLNTRRKNTHLKLREQPDMRYLPISRVSGEPICPKA